MKKEKIKNIVLIMVLMIITSTITSYATSSYLFDSVDVKYDNSNGVQAETVQGAIDELYSCASNYSSLNNKINGYFQNNPTPFFNESSLVFVNNNKIVGTLANNDDNNGIALVGWDNNESGKGKLELYGNPVQINGISLGNIIKMKSIKIACSSMTNGMDLSSYVSIDTGYKFLAWQTLGTSDDWVSSFPIYTAVPLSVSGLVYWNGTLSSSYYVTFYYFEIISY